MIRERDRKITSRVGLVVELLDPRELEDADVTRHAEIGDRLNACSDQDGGLRFELRQGSGHCQVSSSVPQPEPVVRIEKKPHHGAPWQTPLERLQPYRVRNLDSIQTVFTSFTFRLH